MPKFAAASMQDLQTAARDAGRLARKAKFIVAVEAEDGSWAELDALDQGHAGVLMESWVDLMGARGASAWRACEVDGGLFPRPFATRFAS